MKDHIKQNKGKYLTGGLTTIGGTLLAINFIIDQGEILYDRLAKASEVPDSIKTELRVRVPITEKLINKDTTTIAMQSR